MVRISKATLAIKTKFLRKFSFEFRLKGPIIEGSLSRVIFKMFSFFFVSSANVFSVGNIRNPHALPLFSCLRATFSTQRIGFLFDETYIELLEVVSESALVKVRYLVS